MSGSPSSLGVSHATWFDVHTGDRHARPRRTASRYLDFLTKAKDVEEGGSCPPSTASSGLARMPSLDRRVCITKITFSLRQPTCSIRETIACTVLDNIPMPNATSCGPDDSVVCRRRFSSNGCVPADTRQPCEGGQCQEDPEAPGPLVHAPRSLSATQTTVVVNDGRAQYMPTTQHPQHRHSHVPRPPSCLPQGKGAGPPPRRASFVSTPPSPPGPAAALAAKVGVGSPTKGVAATERAPAPPWPKAALSEMAERRRSSSNWQDFSVNAGGATTVAAAVVAAGALVGAEAGRYVQRMDVLGVPSELSVQKSAQPFTGASGRLEPAGCGRTMSFSIGKPLHGVPARRSSFDQTALASARRRCSMGASAQLRTSVSGAAPGMGSLSGLPADMPGRTQSRMSGSQLTVGVSGGFLFA